MDKNNSLIRSEAEEWLTLAQVAKIAKVSRTTVWRWSKHGLRAIRIGGIVRVRWTDLNEFLCSGETC
jgi:excisionase family DNA binding protein